MKTAVSVPDTVFASAERLSHRLGISRSRLYALAVEEFVKSHRRKSIKEALDDVCSSEPSETNLVLSKMQNALAGAGGLVMRRGEIWWASLSALAGSGPGYRRQVLVVQSNEFTESR